MTAALSFDHNPASTCPTCNSLEAVEAAGYAVYDGVPNWDVCPTCEGFGSMEGLLDFRIQNVLYFTGTGPVNLGLTGAAGLLHAHDPIAETDYVHQLQAQLGSLRFERPGDTIRFTISADPDNADARWWMITRNGEKVASGVLTGAYPRELRGALRDLAVLVAPEFAEVSA